MFKIIKQSILLYLSFVYQVHVFIWAASPPTILGSFANRRYLPDSLVRHWTLSGIRSIPAGSDESLLLLPKSVFDGLKNSS